MGESGEKWRVRPSTHTHKLATTDGSNGSLMVHKVKGAEAPHTLHVDVNVLAAQQHSIELTLTVLRGLNLDA